MKVLNDQVRHPGDELGEEFIHHEPASAPSEPLKLYPCPACGRDVAELAYECPGCGQPFRLRVINQTQNVSLCGFNIPFGGWVGLIFTIGIAAIPAGILLSVAYYMGLAMLGIAGSALK